MNGMRVLDQDICDDLIRKRKQLGQDHHDEVWDGVYVMPSMPSLDHQDLVTDLVAIFWETVVLEHRGRVQPGANVSDRRVHWKQNFRVPDIVVALKNGQAVDCGTYWFGGPDFLVEIESPGDDTANKLPFYSEIRVRELLIIHRDSRKLTLLRHDGDELAEVAPVTFQGGKWLRSEVLPLAFRRKTGRPSHWRATFATWSGVAAA